MGTRPHLRRSRPSLDQPREGRRSLRPTYDPETFGALSERIARFIGSWRFIAWMTAFIIGWLVWNIAAPEQWAVDPYPFIFLTLLLSLQASYAAPLILLAQNRQTDRDRVQYQEDRGSTEMLIADTEYITRELASLRNSVGEVVTRDYLRAELRAILEQLEERDGPNGSDRDRKSGKDRDRAPSKDRDRKSGKDRDRPSGK